MDNRTLSDKFVGLSLRLIGISFVFNVILVATTFLSDSVLSPATASRAHVFLVGIILVNISGLMMFLNYGSEGEHQAVAPYSGLKSMGQTAAFCLNLVILALGLSAIVAGLVGLTKARILWEAVTGIFM